MPAKREVPEAVAQKLERLYTEGVRLIDVGKPFGYDYKTVRRILVSRGVTIRDVGGPRKPLDINPEKLNALLREGKSCNQIAKLLGTYQQKVANFIRDSGQEPVDGRNRRGSKSPLTKSGRRVSKEGYMTVLLEPHEYHLRGSRQSHGNTMLEHRLVVARSLGRALFDYENVHHRNGDRSDNQLENLELWERGQPPGQRAHEAPARKHCPTCTCCQQPVHDAN